MEATVQWAHWEKKGTALWSRLISRCSCSFPPRTDTPPTSQRKEKIDEPNKIDKRTTDQKRSTNVEEKNALPARRLASTTTNKHTETIIVRYGFVQGYLLLLAAKFYCILCLGKWINLKRFVTEQRWPPSQIHKALCRFDNVSCDEKHFEENKKNYKIWQSFLLFRLDVH